MVNSNFITTLDTIASDIDYGWSSQPEMATIQYDIPGPIFQEAITGDISPETACEKAARQVRNRVSLE